MSQPLLSILIPTVVGREEQMDAISMRVIGQLTEEATGLEALFGDVVKGGRIVFGNVELIHLKDNKELTIGEKRELLYKEAWGLYSWQLDDDDDISDNALKLILGGIDLNPDVITFEEHIDIDGKIEMSNHSLSYGDWEGEGGKELWDGFHYHRTPFFKSVIKTEIAKSVPIPHIRFGEDHQWAQVLKPHLQTEFHINEQLYKYIHRSSNPTERYGLDK